MLKAGMLRLGNASKVNGHHSFSTSSTTLDKKKNLHHRVTCIHYATVSMKGLVSVLHVCSFLSLHGVFKGLCTDRVRLESVQGDCVDDLQFLLVQILHQQKHRLQSVRLEGFLFKCFYSNVFRSFDCSNDLVRNHAVPIANISIPKPLWIKPVLTFLKGSLASLVTGEERDSNLSLARSFIPSCSLILLKDRGKQVCC